MSYQKTLPVPLAPSSRPAARATRRRGAGPESSRWVGPLGRPRSRVCGGLSNPDPAYARLTREQPGWPGEIRRDSCIKSRWAGLWTTDSPGVRPSAARRDKEFCERVTSMFFVDLPLLWRGAGRHSGRLGNVATVRELCPGGARQRRGAVLPPPRTGLPGLLARAARSVRGGGRDLLGIRVLLLVL